MYYFIAIFNVIALYLAIINDRKTWWFAIAGTTLASVMFFNDMMISSFLFNVYSTVCSIIALFTWKKANTENRMFLYFDTLIWATPLLVVALIYLNVYVFNSEYFIFDSLGPTFAIIATYLLVKKNVLAYVFWILCDINYLVCGIVSNTTHYIIIYTVMLLLSIYGFKRNIKICS